MHIVYKIVGSSGRIEYFGVTKNPDARLRHHKSIKFRGRKDIEMVFIESFQNRKDALLLEGKLKLENGFEWMEKTIGKMVGSLGKKITEDQANEIRIKWRTGNYLGKDLALEYGFKTPSSIYRIVNNESY